MMHRIAAAGVMAGVMCGLSVAHADVISDAGTVTLHLDAAALGLNDGDAVANWGSLTQATADKQPTYVAAGINGLAAVNFDGGNHATGDALRWDAAGLQARTVFAVVNSHVGEGLNGLVSNGNDGQNIRTNDASRYRADGFNADGNDLSRFGTVWVNGVKNGTYSANTPHIVAVEAASLNNYSNFILGGPKTSGTAGDHWDNRYWNGDVSEVIVYSDQLSINQRYNVLNSLGAEYNIAVKRGTKLTGLLGGDLTDPENDGATDSDVNYNATFSGNNEAHFGGSEGAFNVFDNRTGGGNDKWCCDGVKNNNTDGADFHWVAAQFDVAYQLTHFTLTSSNDTPGRDPRDFAIQGSNDGVNWTDIFVQQNMAASLWGSDRSTTLLFEAGVDYDLPEFYSHFRFAAYHTGLSGTGPSDFALGEIEYFGISSIPTPAALPAGLTLITLMAARRRRRA